MMIRNSLTSSLGNLVVVATALLFSSSTTVVVKAQWANAPPSQQQNPPTQQFEQRQQQPPQQQFQDSSSECTATSADVVVIGAGVSGIRAAARIKEVAPDLTVVVLESTERTGGRVRSQYGFGETGDITIEDGANWVYQDVGDDNIIYKMTVDTGLQHKVSDFYDFTTYQYDEFGGVTPVAKDDMTKAYENFRSGPFQKALDYSDKLWEEEVDEDFYLSKTLEENNFTPSNPLEYAAKWMFIDYEHAAADISHYAVFDVDANPFFMVSDEKGFESIIQNYAVEHDIQPIYGQRVYRVKYDSTADASMQSEAEVYARDSSGACRVYHAKRVISTVSTGVLNENLIEFVPTLARPAPEKNPMEMYLYVKFFYQFEEQFWDDTEYIRILRDESNDNLGDKGSLCHTWINLNKFIEGSNTLMCTLTTEEFDKLVGGETERKTTTLSNNDLLDLLEPIKIGYPTNYKDPTAMYYPPINTDADFGFGAYGDWKVGFTPYDYFRFYGGGSDNYYLANEPGEWDESAVYTDCIHNGCNGNKEWILYVSGAASCLEYYEYVHGGYYAGEVHATYALMSLGYEDQIEPGWYDKCYNGILDGKDGQPPAGGDKERDNEKPDKQKKDKKDKNKGNGSNGQPVALPKAVPATPVAMAANAANAANTANATPHNHPILNNDRGQAHQQRKGSVTIIRSSNP